MLEELLNQRMNKLEVIPMEIKLPSAQQSQRPWMKFAGVFKDDPDFDAVEQYIQEYRQELDAAENAGLFHSALFALNSSSRLKAQVR